MQRIEQRTKNGVKVPFSFRPKKKYSFPTPIPPTSVVVWKMAPPEIWGLEALAEPSVLVTTVGWTVWIAFGSSTKVRSLYGKNRPQIPPMDEKLAKDA